MKILLTSEVAKMLRISEDHCRRLIRDGLIKGYKEGKRGGFRITEQAVNDYVAAKLKDGAK